MASLEEQIKDAVKAAACERWGLEYWNTSLECKRIEPDGDNTWTGFYDKPDTLTEESMHVEKEGNMLKVYDTGEGCFSGAIIEIQMHRPLFEEPTDDIERVDAWDEPLGFMVGGIANMSPQNLAEQYFDAASLLTNIILNRDCEDYRLANPTLFLYRHMIELLLKAAIGPEAPITHSLDDLADEFVTFIKRDFDADVPDWIVTRIKELAQIDPSSTAFRYNQNSDKTARKGKAAKKKAPVYTPVDGEFHVNLRHLQNTMKDLYADLTKAIDEISRRRRV